METCSTCKHWQRDNRNHDPADYGTCQLTISMANEPLPEAVKFWPCCSCDSESDNTWIETDENFGCIHWLSA